MGRTTYEWVLDHEKGSVAVRAARPGCSATTSCAGSTATSGSRSGDVSEHHAAMVEAAGGKDVWVVGGGDLAGQFADAGLLDEVIVYIAPVFLGAGAPLFPRRQELKLAELAQNGEFACARYAVVVLLTDGLSRFDGLRRLVVRTDGRDATMDAADPTWPLFVLAAIQLGDAAVCVKPIAPVAACFDDVDFPRRYWWVFTPDQARRGGRPRGRRLGARDRPGRLPRAHPLLRPRDRSAHPRPRLRAQPVRQRHRACWC